MKNITIVIKEGLIESVHCNDPDDMRVVILDTDIEGNEPDDDRIYGNTAFINEHRVDFFTSISEQNKQALALFLKPEAVDSFVDKDKDTLCLRSLWHTDDIKMRRPDLSNEQCRNILQALDRSHDSEIGINWDVIDSTASEMHPEPDNIYELRQQY